MIVKNETNTREIANYLLNHCFVVGNQDRERYNYIATYRDEFDSIFKPIGYELKDDPTFRIMQLRNLYGGRISLKKHESIFLIILGLIYANKIDDLNFKSNEVVTTVREIKEEFDKLNLKNLNKQARIIGFNRFLEDGIKKIRTYNIIQINGKLENLDSQIKILPSIRMVMPNSKILTISESATSYLEQWKDNDGGNDDNDNNDRYDEENN